MAFDLTNLTANDTNILDFAQVTNDAAEGVPFAGLVLALFVIQTVTISSRSQVGIAGSGTLSAWLCFIYSLFLGMAGLLNFFFVIGFLTPPATKQSKNTSQHKKAAPDPQDPLPSDPAA